MAHPVVMAQNETMKRTRKGLFNFKLDFADSRKTSYQLTTKDEIPKLNRQPLKADINPNDIYLLNYQGWEQIMFTMTDV